MARRSPDGAMEAPKPRNALRRLERWAVGLVLAMFAFAIEKMVLRSLKRTGEGPKPEPSPPIARRDPGGGIHA